jgi:molybdopterin synthase catalytic subunit
VALWGKSLPTEALTAWAHRPHCGAVVAFAGTTRDHGLAPDGGVRTGVTRLDYEAYEGPALDRMAAVADSVLEGWPDCGAVVVAHRLGTVPLGEASVLVVVAAPHREEAFAAARHAIDATKATVPIWKREHHDAGVDWGADATPLVGAQDAAAPADPGAGAVVREHTPVADTGGAARRVATAGSEPPGGGASATPDPPEHSWAT